MNADKKNKITLENALGKLLGFEVGEAEDLLEHLFTIESEEDLSEYLVQLLGGQSPELAGFAENMMRYRRGEPLNKTTIGGNNNDNDEKEAKQTAAAVVSSSQDDTAALDSFKAMALGKNAEASKKGNKNIKPKQGNKSRVPAPKKGNRKSPPPPSTASANISSSSTNNKAQNQSTPSSSSHPKSQNHQTKKSEQQHQAAVVVVVEKTHPSRGKAKKICGCFGTKHKPLTNCLYCGRISCQVEGYDFCPMCGFMVEAGM